MENIKEIGSSIGAIVVVIVVIVIFGLYSLGQLLVMFGANDSPDPYYDATAEQDAIDRKMRDQLEAEERKQKAQEAQDAYDDYLEWVRSGRPE